jgi:hypothetical protein
MRAALEAAGRGRPGGLLGAGVRGEPYHRRTSVHGDGAPTPAATVARVAARLLVEEDGRFVLGVF